MSWNARGNAGLGSTVAEKNKVKNERLSRFIVSLGRWEFFSLYCTVPMTLKCAAPSSSSSSESSPPSSSFGDSSHESSWNGGEPQ